MQHSRTENSGFRTGDSGAQREEDTIGLDSERRVLQLERRRRGFLLTQDC